MAVERVGLDDVGAGRQIAGVHGVHHTRIRPGHVVRAVFEVGAAVVFDAQPRLQDAAHRAVEDEDAGGERVFELLSLEMVHVGGSNLSPNG